jgi:chromate transport protein ChrA
VVIITYRRTGGAFALVGLAAAAVAATVLTIAAATTILIVALAGAAVALFARAALPASWRRRTPPPATPWPQETIEATVVTPTRSADDSGLLRMDSDKG